MAKNGDRDGLPNVLVEAQSQALSCVSTPVSGVTELLEDGLNACIVPSEDPEALAAALARMIAAPDLRRTQGLAGQAIVREKFSCDTGIAELMALFEATQPGERRQRAVA